MSAGVDCGQSYGTMNKGVCMSKTIQQSSAPSRACHAMATPPRVSYHARMKAYRVTNDACHGTLSPFYRVHVHACTHARMHACMHASFDHAGRRALFGAGARIAGGCWRRGNGTGRRRSVCASARGCPGGARGRQGAERSSACAGEE